MATQRELDNTAIGSWAGFIYQGLCGIYHVLWMLSNQWEKYNNYKLWLDSYEDFAIMDGNEKITHLVQCKDIKGKTRYDDEFSKMVEKKNKYIAEKKCADNVVLYFICNKDLSSVDVPEEVELYPGFLDKNKFCEPSELKEKLLSVIDKLKDNEKIEKETDSDFVIDALSQRVNAKVLELQEEYFNSKDKKLHDIVFNKGYITFAEIKEDLNPSGIYMSKNNLLEYAKCQYVLQFEKIRKNKEEDGSTINSDGLNEFIKILMNKKNDEINHFLQNAFPDKQTKTLQELLSNTTGDSSIRNIFRVVNDVKFGINDDFSWHEKNKLERVSGINDDGGYVSPREICQNILENAYNNNFLYESDYFVGIVKSDIEDISKMVNNISDTTPIDYNNIFNNKKVGILTIDSMNNGNYN